LKIGEKLKFLRNEKDYTLKQLAALTGISISFISDIENGRRIPGLEYLGKLADGLGVSAYELIIEADNNEKDMLSTMERVKNRDMTRKTSIELLGTYHNRPEVIELLKTIEHSTREDVLKAIKIVKALKDK
jgi:transcriptional regulator with XRE-family HTH domain